MAAGESLDLSDSESPFMELDVNLGDMDMDGVMQLLEPEENTEFPSDFSFSTAPSEGRRGRPRKRISVCGRGSTRAKSSSCSSSAAGSVRGGGGGGSGEKRRVGRGGGAGRGHRGAIAALQSTLQTMISNYNGGGTRKKDDDEYIHTVIVSANDEFVFSQDICVICGSFGKGPEGCFIVCMQCGQCYHSYCANININATILRRGWRCLDCTVCEGCGRGDDEQHLLLCDECDVSFHTYCLDPPLDTIPAGAWICKGCSSCQVCGDTLFSNEMSNCATKICSRCDSMVSCPICRQKYVEEDLVIQCETCEKWCHCKCNGLTSEDAMDKAADKGFRCWFCQSNMTASGHDGVDGRSGAGFGKAVDSSFHVVMDGVSLTKSGLRTVQWRPRRRVAQPIAALPSTASAANLDDVIDSVHAYVTRGLDDHGTGTEESITDERMEDLKINIGGESYASVDPALFSPVDKKFRQKKYLRVGVGGFLVRQTRQRSVNEKIDETQESQDIAAADTMPPDDGRESALGDAGQNGAASVKPKKRRRQMRKTAKVQLQDNYPTYIQEAFFGAPVMEMRSIVGESKLKLDDQESPLLQARALPDNELAAVAPSQTKTVVEKPGSGHRRGESGHYSQGGAKAPNQLLASRNTSLQAASGTSSERLSTSTHQDPIGESFEDLGEGDDIFPHQMDIQHHEFSNLIDMLMGDGDMDPVDQEDVEQTQSPNLENLIDSRDYVGIGEVDSAEIDRLMGNMLDDELPGCCDSDANSRQHAAMLHHHQPPQQSLQGQQMPGSAEHLSVQNQSLIMSHEYHQQQMQQSSSVPFGHDPSQHLASHHHHQLDHVSSHNPYRANASSAIQNQLPQQQHSSDGIDFGQDPSRYLSSPQQPHPPPVVNPVHIVGQEMSVAPHGVGGLAYHSAISPKGDTTSAADPKTYFERWEPDESLGDRATIAAVLYANTSHPDLRLKYPTWTERAKQIAKLWRLLAPDQRQQYVQLARENRAACRQMTKAKKATGEPVSRQLSQTSQVSSSPNQQAEHHAYSTSGTAGLSQMQEFKPFPDHQANVRPEAAQSIPLAATDVFGAGSSSGQSFGTMTIQPPTLRMDEFKVPHTPTGNLYRQDSLKRSDSQPQMPRVLLEEQIKPEPYFAVQQQQQQQQSIPSEQGLLAAGHQSAYGSYGPQVGFSPSSGSYEQQCGNQTMDWNRCQNSLLEDFIEMEKRDQRSRQPSQSEQFGKLADPSANPQPPIAAGASHWADVSSQRVGPPQASASQFGPRPPMAMLQRQRSLGSAVLAEGTSEGAGSVGALPRDRQHEEWLSRTQHQYEVQMKAVEMELNQLRKSKKNIASKQRQLKKNGLELSIDDASHLSRLGQDISERQKQLEQLRKQAKQHHNLIQDYNVKHGLVEASASAPPTPGAQHPHGPILAPGAPMFSSTVAVHPHPNCGPDMMDGPQQFVRSLPATPTTPGHPGPQFGESIQHRMPHVEMNPYGDPFVRSVAPGHMMNIMQPYPQPAGYRPNTPYMGQQQSPISSMAASFPNVGAPMALAPSRPTLQQPGAAAAAEPKKKKKYYGKKKVDAGPSKPGIDDALFDETSGRRNSGCKTFQAREKSPPCPSSNLLAMAPDFDADVVMTVSYLLDNAVLELDGPSGAAAAERENVLLKRLLDHSPTSEFNREDGKKAKQKEMQPGKRGAASSGQGSPKKRQRKMGPGAASGGPKSRSMTPSNQSMADANSFLLEQLTASLKALPPLTIQEPAPRSDPLISNIFGVTQLMQRAEKPLLVGNGPGGMRLTFMPDYFLDVFNKPTKQQAMDIQFYQQRQAMTQQQNLTSSNAMVPNSYGIGQIGAPRPFALQQPLPFPVRMQVNGMGQQILAMDGKQFDGQDNFPSGHQMAMSGGVPRAQAPFGFGRNDVGLPHPESRSLMESPVEVIYGDSPEFDEDLLPSYPALKPIVPAEGRLSPNFRLVAPVPVRAVPPDPPSFYDQPPPVVAPGKSNLSSDDEADMVPVTITLDADVLRNGGVHDVLRGLAALLQIDVPKKFEVHIDTPPHTPEKEISKEAADLFRRCRHCEIVVQQASVRKKLAELGLTPKEDDADEVIFCSQLCFDKFASSFKTSAVPIQATEAKVAVCDVQDDTKSVMSESRDAEIQSVGNSTPVEIVQQTTSKKLLGPGRSEENRFDEIIRSVLGDTQIVPSYGSKEEVVHVRDLPRLKDSTAGDEINKSQVYEMRWKGTKWKPWSSSLCENVLAVTGLTMEMMYEHVSKALFRPTALPKDVRVCDFCATVGDGPAETCGRLLNLDAGRWVHVNCALWSAEVYERVEGALVNVEKAVRRASGDVCSFCQRYGASIPCYKLRCDKNYHLPCAVENGCTFMKDKTMLCPNHSAGTSDDDVLGNLAVIRRVYIERDENRIIAKLYQQGDSGELTLRVGSLIFGHIGQLLPHQLRNFHVKDYIYPAGYTASRIYWSSKDVRQRNMYLCNIADNDGRPEFRVSFHEDNFADITFAEFSASASWNGILQPLEELRLETGMLKLFSNYLTGEVLFGLAESAIVKMIESLPGVDLMPRYECKFGRSPLIDLPLAVNPSGCARCEPRFRTYIKRSHTHTASTSGSFQTHMALSGLSAELALYQYGGNRQTLVSKWSQYRKMKQEWQGMVYLARSKIQGLGLYAKRDIEMNSMVIEYIGEVIRNEVAERREKQYEAHNRGIYMFRIDEESVIDATMSGGLARYINHSCDPNCVAESFEFDKESKIIIMACRPIMKGEELTYDYQFDVEDDSSKIPCLCGAPNCQKWMN